MGSVRDACSWLHVGLPSGAVSSAPAASGGVRPGHAPAPTHGVHLPPQPVRWPWGGGQALSGRPGTLIGATLSGER